MRSKVLALALLVFGCAQTEPMADAEPTTDGAPATDEKPAAGGAAPAPASPTDEPAAAAALERVPPTVAEYPPASGTCALTLPGAAAATQVATWDAESRTLRADYMAWTLDDAGFVTQSLWSPDYTSGWAYGRDEHGTLTSAHSIPGQTLYVEQANSYGAAGELLQTVETQMSGQVITTRHEYDSEGRLTGTFSRNEYAGRVTESFTQREYDGNRLRAIRRGRVGEVGEQHASSVSSFFYDDAGHLIRVDIAGAGLVAFHGGADIRQQWRYDDDGRITRFEQDGTTVVDAPIVDGVPDIVIEYAPDCAQIAAYPAGFYRLPEAFAD